MADLELPPDDLLTALVPWITAAPTASNPAAVRQAALAGLTAYLAEIQTGESRHSAMVRAALDRRIADHLAVRVTIAAADQARGWRLRGITCAIETLPDGDAFADPDDGTVFVVEAHTEAGVRARVWNGTRRDLFRIPGTVVQPVEILNPRPAS